MNIEWTRRIQDILPEINIYLFLYKRKPAVEKTPLKIFIASSGELERERDQAILTLSRLNNAHKDFQLEPVRWEYAIIRGSFFDNENIQAVITPKLQESDLAVFIFYSRLGVYTLEEFECARKEKKKTFIFFKRGFSPATEEEKDGYKKLTDFKTSLSTTVLTIDFEALKDFEYELFVNINLYLLEKIDADTNFNQPFNRYLTKNLIESFAPYNKKANELLKSPLVISSTWEKERSIIGTAQKIIGIYFKGILGIQIRKIFAIGLEKLTESKKERYVENCVLACKKSLQVIWFTLLSHFWDIQKKNKYALSVDQINLLDDFFETSFEPDIPNYINWIKCIAKIYKQNDLLFPFHDLEQPLEQFDDQKDFIKAAEKLHILSNKINSSNFSLIDCREAEVHLTQILSDLIFLASYKMISIKSIAYDEIRYATPKFLHDYTDLDMDDTNLEINVEKLNYTENPVATEAVMLFRQNEDYRHGMNLYPFIIDMNVLTFEPKPKLCFYSCRGLADNSIVFKCLDDDSDINIVFTNIAGSTPSLNDVISDREKRKKFRLDNIISQFKNARNTILKTQTE